MIAKQIYLGNSSVKRVMLGAREVWAPNNAPWDSSWVTPYDEITSNCEVNGYNIVTKNANAANAMMRVPFPPGKWYVEGVVDILGNWDEVGGIAISSNRVPIDYGSLGAGWEEPTCAVYPSGGPGDWYFPVWFFGERYLAPDSSAIVAGENIIGFAVDVSSRKVWARINGGAWANNNLGIGDPVSGANPSAIIPGDDPLYFGASTFKPTRVVGLRITATDIPTGYSSPWT